MSDPQTSFEAKIRRILATAETPYDGRPGEAFLNRAWEAGAEHMVERVLAILEEHQEHETKEEIQPVSDDRFQKIRNLWDRFMTRAAKAE